MLAWRSRQAPGAIMSPHTFENIEAKAQAKGFSEARQKKIAGAAYWKTAKAKYKESKS